MLETVYFVAMDDEIKGVFDLENFSSQKELGFTIHKHLSKPIAIVKTGIGKSNAAAAAQFALHNYPAKHYINTGLVGSFNKTFALGQVVHISQCRFFDVDVTAFNYAPGQLPQCEHIHYPLKKFSDQQTKLSSAFLVSGDTFLNNPELRTKMISIFQPDVIDMELTSIAHVFHLHDKLDSLTSIKAVSDYADESSHVDFYELMTNALLNLKEHFSYAKSK
jgi:adenosylhomocysteine nucleosidase